MGMTVHRSTAVAGAKLAVFTAVSVLVTGVLVAIMGNFGGGDTNKYSAVFTNASMVQEGDDVRVAGVVLGQVESVDVHGADRAIVEFTVARDLPLTDRSRVEIRYLNLVGDRYVTVLRGGPGGTELPDGATIGVDRTTPALNLSALYNGFAPLFNALEPEQVNELSLNLVRVLQGEGGTIEGLMRHTASLTSAIADRDELVGEVITNLDELLGTVDSRQQQLTRLIKELRRWVGGLAEDRVQIGRSVVNISQLTGVMASLLSDARPLVKADIAQLRRLAHVLSREDTKQVIARVLRDLPEMLQDQTRTGTYGSWYNYYVCAANASITLPTDRALEELLRERLPADVELPDLPVLDLIDSQLRQQLKDIRLRSDAARCAT